MKIFTIFLLREFLKYFLIVNLVFFSFSIVIELFEKLPFFLSFHKPFIYFLEYLFWKSFINLYQLFPYFTALSIILKLFFLSRTRELLALFSIGITKEEILRRLLIFLAFISFTGGIFLNLVVPEAYYKSLYVWETKIQGKQAQRLIFKDLIFYEGEKFFLMGRPMEIKGEYFSDVTLLFLEKGEPKKIIWAKEAFYIEEGRWQFKEMIFQEGEWDFQPKFYKTWEGQLPIKPKDFLTVEKPLKFAKIGDLKKRLFFLWQIGKPVDEVLGELLFRFIYLFIPFILGAISAKIYLKAYTIQNLNKALLNAFLAFLIFNFLFILFQNLVPKYFLLSLMVLFVGLVFSLIILRK